MDGLFIEGFSIDWDNPELAGSYLNGIPAVRGIGEMTFRKSITFLAGENGSGKSTLLEALAIASGLNPEGGTQNYAFSTYDDTSLLGNAVRLRRQKPKPKWSYFLRAESFYNMATATMTRYNDDGRMPDYHSQSHGESFLEFVQRYDSPGLYLMDEPEAALSPQRQLSLLVHLFRASREGAQFIIATHSPILLGLPCAEIWSFDGGAVHPVEWEETESVRLTKLFLGNRERFLKELLADE